MKKVIVTVVAIAAVIGAVFTVKSCKLIKPGKPESSTHTEMESRIRRFHRD